MSSGDSVGSSESSADSSINSPVSRLFKSIFSPSNGPVLLKQMSAAETALHSFRAAASLHCSEADQ
jgi:hypothetical protein